MEKPEYWVILEIEFKSGIEYKVFASWPGGYLDGDCWKLNSGIEKVEEDEEYYYFYGFSGSCYKCHKKGYGCYGIHNKLKLQELNKMKNVRLCEEKEIPTIIEKLNR